MHATAYTALRHLTLVSTGVNYLHDKTTKQSVCASESDGTLL